MNPANEGVFMRLFRSLLTAAAVSALLAGTAHAQDARTAEALRDKALRDRTAWDVTEDLTTSIGPRIVGSPAMARAKDWGVAKFKALGFTNVKVEEFAKPSWTRGAESAELVGPIR
jgi:hypothetical protein